MSSLIHAHEVFDHIDCALEATSRLRSLVSFVPQAQIVQIASEIGHTRGDGRVALRKLRGFEKLSR